MPDREKVINGLEDIQKHLNTGYSFAISWKSKLIRDALELLKEQQEQIDRLIEENASNTEIAEGLKELLKEQEEKRTPKPIIHGHKEEYWGEEEICPDCGKKWQSEIIDTTYFCPGCGRAVKWE